MEAAEISAIFSRNEFPFEMDEDMTQYLAEILTDSSITKQDRDELITTLIISAYGEDIQPILTRIRQDITSLLNDKQKSQKMNQRKKKEMIFSQTPSPVSIPLQQSPPQQVKGDQLPRKVSKTSEEKKTQSFFPVPHAIEPESPQLISLRTILHENGVPSDSLDETITEYLNEVCADEMMSLEELQEIILTYFPSLDGDAVRAKRIILSLITTRTTSEEPPPSLTQHSPLLSCPEGGESDDDDDGVESKSHDSDLGDWEDDEESELTSVNVDEIQEIFPHLPRLTLQYVHRIKCFESFTETCQHLLDHQTGSLHPPRPHSSSHT
jgi:hypothetical protein